MESTEADRRRGRADGLRSRSDCPCAPLAAFGVSISRMSARRGVQEAGRNARKKRAGRARGHVTSTGADETVVRVKCEKAGVVADAATSEVLGVDVLVKRDAREKQDKAQDGQGGQERIQDAERVWAEAAGLERSGLTGSVRAVRGGIRAVRNPSPNAQPFLGRLSVRRALAAPVAALLHFQKGGETTRESDAECPCRRQ